MAMMSKDNGLGGDSNAWVSTALESLESLASSSLSSASSSQTSVTVSETGTSSAAASSATTSMSSLSLFSTPQPTDPRTIGFAFDIDGVLLRGTHPLPGAASTLKKLQQHQIPFILLTNGGGLTEAAHAARVTTRLGVTIHPQQLIQSHTPFHDLVPAYKDKTVLALGGTAPQVRSLASAYGFNNIVTSSDLLATYPHLHPFAELTREHHLKHGRVLDIPVKIDLITVWSSPRDWCLDLQIIMDLLLSHGGDILTTSLLNGDETLPNCGFQQDGQPSLHFCNPDFVWPTPHPLPRLAQGGFRAALMGMWSVVTGARAQLRYEICGKPMEGTFVCGERALMNYQEMLNGSREGDVPKVETVYMVGDNPASDIAGANGYTSRCGAEWKSILVESGVYQPGTEAEFVPTHFAKGVGEAVELALKEEGVVLGEEGGGRLEREVLRCGSHADWRSVRDEACAE